jgi:phosphatidylserine decarboxylase
VAITFSFEIAAVEGERFTHSKSRAEITHFIATHKVAVDEIASPLSHFTSLNDFLSRKLKPSARSIQDCDPHFAVSPCDGRAVVFSSMKRAVDLWIKGSKFSVEAMLGSRDLASKFGKPSVAVFRLAAQDYHRFHAPVQGVVTHVEHIPGTYYSMNFIR